MTDEEYDDLLLDAIRCAQGAGEIIMSYFRKKDIGIQAKHGNESDIVTAADKASDRYVIAFLHDQYRPHTPRPNFSAGLPNFSVSIGIKQNGETVVGVVYAPYLGELFHAVKGGGAYLNGERIFTGAKQRLDQCVVATGFPVDKDVNPDNNLDNVSRVLPLVRGMRRLGSAAIDISYVAAGFLDAYWEMNLHEWDVCAGLLIADEAGAKHDNFRGDRNISVVVGSPHVEEELFAILSHDRHV